MRKQLIIAAVLIGAVVALGAQQMGRGYGYRFDLERAQVIPKGGVGDDESFSRWVNESMAKLGKVWREVALPKSDKERVATFMDEEFEPGSYLVLMETAFGTKLLFFAHNKTSYWLVAYDYTGG